MLKCSCGREYWPSQKWIHEKCATNTVATNESATNKEVVLVVGNSQGKTSNRRLRELYNAYQREYMREVRKKRGSSRKVG